MLSPYLIPRTTSTICESVIPVTFAILAKSYSFMVSGLCFHPDSVLLDLPIRRPTSVRFTGLYLVPKIRSAVRSLTRGTLLPLYDDV